MEVETIVYKGYNISIETDECNDMNPRIDMDNLGTMYCYHSRYTLGDKHNMCIEELKEIVKSKDYIVLPLYLYDHSGITMSTSPFSCNWDSGKVGYIVVSKEQVRKEFGWEIITKSRQKQIEDILKSEVEIYDTYIRGDVYICIITKDFEGIDSCGGFYGYDHDASGLMEFAYNIIDSSIKHQCLNEGIQLELELV